MQFVREEISSEGQRVVVVRLNNRQRGPDDNPLFVLSSLLTHHSTSLKPLRGRGCPRCLNRQLGASTCRHRLPNPSVLSMRLFEQLRAS